MEVVAVVAVILSLIITIWFYEYNFTATSIIAAAVILLIFSVVIPVLCIKTIKQKSIVDTLREVE